MAKRAGATITEINGGSHVIMISQPDAVTEVILSALRSVGLAGKQRVHQGSASGSVRVAYETAQ
jgi:hypothetical protein